MRRWVIITGAALAGVILSVILFNFVRPYILRPQYAAGKYQFFEVAKGLARPVYVTHAGDDSGRLFVVEQDGTIRVVQDGQLLEQPFLDVSALVSRDDSERGLLGLAFPPNYPESGLFFINYTDVNGNTVIAHYQVSTDDPNRADAKSMMVVLKVIQPYPNHNAGQLAFGPDGYLYVGFGDGGSAGDPHGNGQNRKVLLAKMLRLKVDGSAGYAIPPDNPFANDNRFAPEIWAMGLRNPWRYSFDRATGDLYIADVGQGNWEEVDFQPASSTGGENYGWNAFEGTHSYSANLVQGAIVMPVAEYSHSDGCSITGGYVYRGKGLPDLTGYYIFGDFCSGTTWLTRRDETGQWKMDVFMNTGRVISSFGEDQQGEMYLVDYGGSLLRLEAVS